MTARPDVSFDLTIAQASLEQIIELGDNNKKTLGFLPYAGFRTAATSGRVAVARDGEGHFLGYCLFDLPRDMVRIVQLCISNQARGTNLARTLIDAVSARHCDRLGMVLKCRADWPADSMWPRLGFVAQTQVRGRSKEGHPLTVWWRSHGHADLFTLLEEHRAGAKTAAIDSNVYSDLHSAKRRNGAKHTAVLAPLVAAEILNLILLPSLESEIYATADQSERARFLNAQVNYTRASDPCSDEIVEHLVAQISKSVLAKDPSLQRDAELVAEAYANDIDLFITRDQPAIKHLTAPGS